MAQYKTGTVNVTNGSATVELVGGAAIAEIGSGDVFVVSDPTLNGAGVSYEIASNPVADDEFALTAPWAGDTATGRAYVVHRDFRESGVPIFASGDIEWPPMLNRAFAEVEAGGGGGGSSTFQGLSDAPAYANNAGGVVAVNEDEDGVEYRDHRFFADLLAELAPTGLSGRLVHYSMISGTLTQSGGRASAWNDISGNSRHAAADDVGPRVVGAADLASYGMSFDGAAGDDVMMLATVPASQNSMFLFVIGRCDPTHSVSRNLLKTAHAAGIDSQTAGDIELAAAASGNGLILRISTSAASGQVISLPALKNGQPFALALALDEGDITGWIAGQHQTPQEISTTYQHGTGFDTDSLRLGQSVDEVTAQTLHEVLIASTLPTSANMQGLIIWARNRYFLSQLGQDESNPRFSAAVRMQGHQIIGPAKPMIMTDGVDLTVFFGPAKSLASQGLVSSEEAWSGAAFVHSGGDAFALTLLATHPVGWELDVAQEASTGGSVGIVLDTGATNQNGFDLTVAAGNRVRLRVVANDDGSSAEYVGYVEALGELAALDFLPGSRQAWGEVELDATGGSPDDGNVTFDGGDDELIVRVTGHTVARNLTIDPAPDQTARTLIVSNEGTADLAVIDHDSNTIDTVVAGSIQVFHWASSAWAAGLVFGTGTGGGSVSISRQVLTVGDGATLTGATHGKFTVSGSTLTITKVRLRHASNQASTVTVTVEDGMSDTEIEIHQAEDQTGQCSVALEGSPPSATLNGGTDSIALLGAGSSAVLIATASNTYRLKGDIDAPIDVDGQIIEGNRARVLTSVTGSLTKETHSGRVLVTSGNVTVPNGADDVGFNATLIAGGAHTVTFNSTTSAAMATGDVMTVIVQSTTVIKAALVEAADLVSFT